MVVELCAMTERGIVGLCGDVRESEVKELSKCESDAGKRVW